MTMSTHSVDDCAARWTRVLAPSTGDVREELTLELSEYLGQPREVVVDALDHATELFTEEWTAKVADPTDEREVVRFYNESQTELFDLARWHAEDAIHYRTPVCCDAALERPGREYLDYGSGIGSDALVFGAAGFKVTLADVSEPLLRFATWRCERRGLSVTVVDLKRTALPQQRFDAVVCFDVLEHIPDPVSVLRRIHAAMRPGALLFLHAPFGVDPERPMHVVHEDVVSDRMLSLGYHWRDDLERAFPAWQWTPRVYESLVRTPLDRVAYAFRDRWLPRSVGDRLGRVYRKLAGSARRLSG